jgi:hypothetical protein
VSPASALLARRPPGGPHELDGNTLAPASHHRAIGERAVTTLPARPARLQHAGHSAAGPGRQAEAQQPFGRLRVAGCHASGLRPRTDFSPALCDDFKLSFNCFNSQKIVQASKIRRNLYECPKIYKINFV